MDPRKHSKMEITCKSCGKSFDTTFTIDDLVSLPRDQYEAGTLHLCPYCGKLLMYHSEDYREHMSE